MTTLNEKISIALPGTTIVIPKPRDQETIIGLYQSHTARENSLEIICDPGARIKYDENAERIILQPHWQKPRDRYAFKVVEGDILLVGEEALKEMPALEIGDYIPFINIMQQLWELRKTMKRYDISFINFYALVPEQENPTLS